jgi:hypothetical protein
MKDARKFSETPTISTMATREKQKTGRMTTTTISTAIPTVMITTIDDYKNENTEQQ